MCITPKVRRIHIFPISDKKEERVLILFTKIARVREGLAGKRLISSYSEDGLRAGSSISSVVNQGFDEII